MVFLRRCKRILEMMGEFFRGGVRGFRKGFREGLETGRKEGFKAVMAEAREDKARFKSALKRGVPEVIKEIKDIK